MADKMRIPGLEPLISVKIIDDEPLRKAVGKHQEHINRQVMELKFNRAVADLRARLSSCMSFEEFKLYLQDLKPEIIAPIPNAPAIIDPTEMQKLIGSTSMLAKVSIDQYSATARFLVRLNTGNLLFEISLIRDDMFGQIKAELIAFAQQADGSYKEVFYQL